jgi:hypothetical protein
MNTPVMETRGTMEHTGERKTMMERQTAKLPTDAFLWAAGGSIAASLTLKMIGRDKDALFVGQWAPTFLALGLFNKLTTLFGTTQRPGA